MATYLALINFVVVLAWLLATCHWIQAIPSKWKTLKERISWEGLALYHLIDQTSTNQIYIILNWNHNWPAVLAQTLMSVYWLDFKKGTRVQKKKNYWKVWCQVSHWLLKSLWVSQVLKNLRCLSQVLVLVCDSSTEKLVSELQFN